MAAVSPNQVTITVTYFTCPSNKSSCLTWPSDNCSCLTCPRENSSCLTWPRDNDSCLTLTWPRDNDSWLSLSSDNYSCLTWSRDNGSCLNWPRENYRCFTWQNNQSSCIAWPITVILASTHLTTWQWQLSSASCPTASTSSSGLVRDSRQLGCRLGLRCTPTHEVINECGLKRCRGVWLNGHEYFINILKAVLIL